MNERILRELSIDELRSRVEEAEKLLRVARQLAQDELRDPESSGRAKDRIAAICTEVNALFPGMGQPAGEEAPDPPPAQEPDTEVGEECRTLERRASRSSEEGSESSDSDTDVEDDEEWDIDYAKLRSAILNPELMGRFPEAERATFKAMAEQLIEAHDRAQLYARVTAGFEQLEQTTRDGAEAVRQQLAMVLTFEELKARTRQ